MGRPLSFLGVLVRFAEQFWSCALAAFGQLPTDVNTRRGRLVVSTNSYVKLGRVARSQDVFEHLGEGAFSVRISGLRG